VRWWCSAGWRGSGRWSVFHLVSGRTARRRTACARGWSISVRNEVIDAPTGQRPTWACHRCLRSYEATGTASVSIRRR